MIRVLIVGSGAREHALAWACRRSGLPERVLCAPGNGGTAAIAENVPVAADDGEGLLRLAVDNGVTLAILGPDASIAAGVGDLLAQAGIACFGPTRAAGRIESSKRFAKELMDEAGIPTARWVAGGADDRERLLGFAAEREGRCVVKADGLALGKGVSVCDDAEEAARAIDACLGGRFGSAGDTVLVEERLEGRELSILALTDGVNLHLLPPSCDYKRAEDADRGPNTGGMGAYAPADGLDTDALLDDVVAGILRPVVDGLARRGAPFRGCLYAGLMVDRRGRPSVLEFNARLGDPETQVVLPLLVEDVVEVLGACAVGGLPEGRARLHRGACVGVVAASRGYPGPVETGHPIDGLDPPNGRDVHVFHAGTARDADGTTRTAGGRVVTVVGRGPDLATARTRALERLDRISFEGKWHRSDIGMSGW